MSEIAAEIGRLIKAASPGISPADSLHEQMVAGEGFKWPVTCTVGRGLAGAVACETKIGYVDGDRGVLSYRGYNIFDLAAYSTFEETAYLVIHGRLPNHAELQEFKNILAKYRFVPRALRTLDSLPVEGMTPMAALRMGVSILRTVETYLDETPLSTATSIDTDADTEAEIAPQAQPELVSPDRSTPGATDLDTSYHLIAGLCTLTAAVARLRRGRYPLEPDPQLGHAANLLYMISGKKPDEELERIMDIVLILHMDHGMNASTFAAMVVASTLTDLYHSVCSGLGALSGPLHGGANEQVIHTLEEIGHPRHVETWFEEAMREKRRIMGFGHRVYRTFDPRAKVLRPLACRLAERDAEIRILYQVADKLEETVIRHLGADKRVFPNVDLYSGLVYRALGIETEMFTSIFGVGRVVGWVARCLEYLDNNRIFRPRAVYTGAVGKKYQTIDER